MLVLNQVSLRRGVKLVLDRASVDAAARARRSASSAATAPASRRCSRCSPAACTPTPATSRCRRAGASAEVAQDMPETDEGATDFVLRGRHAR